MACAFDFRFMRTDRGYFCFPGVDLGIAILPGMDAILKKALPVPLVLEAQLTGRRYTAVELEARRVVVKACPINDLLPEALAFARSQNKSLGNPADHESSNLQNILRVMETEDPAHLEALRGRFSPVGSCLWTPKPES